ncbi:replication protein, partial [Bifidobacterium longum]
MDDDTRSKDLTLPEDEPWMSHGFISKIAAQVSLPYRRPKDGVKEIERRNGSLVVRYVSGADYLPYGKYPRLFELWACTMIKTNDPCFDPETNTLHLVMARGQERCVYLLPFDEFRRIASQIQRVSVGNKAAREYLR